jgi:small-conductance mechanosensitive channel
MTQEAKKVLQGWQDVARDLFHKGSVNLRQQEIAADAIFWAKHLVQFPDHQPTIDKLAAYRNSFLVQSKEEATPFPALPEEKKCQTFSVNSAIQYSQESIKFHQEILAKLKQIEAIKHESPEEARALVHEIEQLGQTRRKFINTHVANSAKSKS